MLINTRADLEAIRGTPEFEGVLRMLFGATARWELVDGAWVLHEDWASVERLGYTTASFLAEIEPLDLEPPTPPSAPPAVSLAALKISLKTRLDADAETERLKYVTPGAGQAMEYQQAAAEAEALLTAIALDPDYEPDPELYPMLAASIGIDGGTLAEVAATVAAMHGQWRQIGSAIRAARLAGKAAIDAAETAEDAQAAFDAVEWPAVA